MTDSSTLPAPAQTASVFPAEGSAEFERFLSQAREGRILFGANKVGDEAVWDMRVDPHALFAGATGSGKTVAATVPIFAALCCPDVFDLIVVDPKGDLAWTAQFPNATYVTEAEASDCLLQVANVAADRAARADWLDRRERGRLTAREDEDPKYAVEDGQAPRRLLVVLHEFDGRRLSVDARAALGSVSRQPRAVEISLLVSAQRASADSVSIDLRMYLAFRLCLGNVDRNTSVAVLGDGRAVARPNRDPLPRGHAWVESSMGPLRDTVIHVLYLPMETQPSPWDSSLRLEGAEERAARHQAFRGDGNDGVPL